MTVAELIDLLQAAPPETPVVHAFWADEWDSLVASSMLAVEPARMNETGELTDAAGSLVVVIRA